MIKVALGKKKGTLSVAFLCTSKPGVIWNSVKEERKKTNLAQLLHGGCECRAIIEHHPGQMHSARAVHLGLAWSVCTAAARSPRGWAAKGMLIVGGAEEMFCRCTSYGRTEPREVTCWKENQASLEAVWEKCANKHLIIKITRRLHGVFNTAWQSEKAEQCSSGEGCGWEMAKRLHPRTLEPVGLAFWGTGL